MIKPEQFSDEAVEAVIVSLYQEKFWALSPEEQASVRSNVRTAFAAGLAAWPGAFPTTTQINRGATEVLILPVRELLSEEIIRLERDKWA